MSEKPTLYRYEIVLSKNLPGAPQQKNVVHVNAHSHKVKSFLGILVGIPLTRDRGMAGQFQNIQGWSRHPLASQHRGDSGLDKARTSEPRGTKQVD